MPKKQEQENLPVTLGHGDSSLALEGRSGSFRMVKQELPIPPDLLYYIGGNKGGLLASAYDMISREGGICFDDTEVIEDSEWDVKVKVHCHYFNAAGKKVVDSEIYQIDVKALYEHSRANYEKIDWNRNKAEGEFEAAETRKGYRGKTTVVITRGIGEVKGYDPDSGLPNIVYRLPPSAELDLYQSMLHLKKTKLAKCITCAHRRLTQRAVGVKQISAEEKDWQTGVAVPIYSFLPDAKGNLQEVEDLYGEEPEDALSTGAPPGSIGPPRPRMAPPSQTQTQPPPPASSGSREASPAQQPPEADKVYTISVSGAKDPNDTYALRVALGKECGLDWNGPTQSWVKMGLNAKQARDLSDAVLNLPDPDGGGNVYQTQRVKVDFIEEAEDF